MGAKNQELQNEVQTELDNITLSVVSYSAQSLQKIMSSPEYYLSKSESDKQIL